MKNNTARFLSMLLSLVMLFSLAVVPSAIAEETEDQDHKDEDDVTK